MSETDAPDDLVDQPPSAKFVYRTLEQKGPMGRSELADETLLPSSTVSWAITELQDADLITSRSDPHNPSRHVYYIPDD